MTVHIGQTGREVKIGWGVGRCSPLLPPPFYSSFRVQLVDKKGPFGDLDACCGGEGGGGWGDGGLSNYHYILLQFLHLFPEHLDCVLHVITFLVCFP